MKKLSNLVSDIQKRFFASVVSDNLVYNTCWEDPRIDRRLLQLNAESRVVMLTSAGCNALEYLLDDVRRIHCVDANPAQNALLELKKALFSNDNFQLLWNFFGDGNKQGAKLIYREQLRHLLPPNARSFWDQHIQKFAPKSSQPSFYFSGTTGKVALMVHKYIRHKDLLNSVKNLLNAKSLEEQTYYFEDIEPQLWNSVLKWLISQRATMTMLGVPVTQRKMIEDEYKNGLYEFIRQSLKHVFTELPLHDNYFWRVYLTGSYSRDCCPNYLLENNFDYLASRVHKVQTYDLSLARFLEQKSDTYSHFVLLDHQDWMANSHPQQLAREWKLILDNAESGARILFRSAGNSLDFLPDFVFQDIDFQPEKTRKAHHQDRVGTYGSTHLAIVQ